jgi:hypothetical protein
LISRWGSSQYPPSGRFRKPLESTPHWRTQRFADWVFGGERLPPSALTDCSYSLCVTISPFSDTVPRGKRRPLKERVSWIRFSHPFFDRLRQGLKADRVIAIRSRPSCAHSPKNLQSSGYRDLAIGRGFREVRSELRDALSGQDDCVHISSVSEMGVERPR